MAETPKDHAIEMAQNALNEIDTYSQHGLPPVYKNAQAWLSDFYPGLPWNDGIFHSLEWLTTNPKAETIIARFSERVNFDMMAELRRALANRER